MADSHKEKNDKKHRGDRDSKGGEKANPSEVPEEEQAPPAHRHRPGLGRFRRVLHRILFEDEEVEFDDALIRTYLANERTFLAWLRTSVVLLGVGLGAVALGGTGQIAEIVAFVLGGFSAVTAIIMVVWAYVSFGTTTAGIEQRFYRPARTFVAVAAMLVISTNLVVLVLLAVEALD